MSRMNLRLPRYEAVLVSYVDECTESTIVNVNNGTNLKNLVFEGIKIVILVKYRYLVDVSR